MIEKRQLVQRRRPIIVRYRVCRKRSFATLGF
jgi:hypothetical protein